VAFARRRAAWFRNRVVPVLPRDQSREFPTVRESPAASVTGHRPCPRDPESAIGPGASAPARRRSQVFLSQSDPASAIARASVTVRASAIVPASPGESATARQHCRRVQIDLGLPTVRAVPAMEVGRRSTSAIARTSAM
jgi:hypothetical protein